MNHKYLKASCVALFLLAGCTTTPEPKIPSPPIPPQPPPLQESAELPSDFDFLLSKLTPNQTQPRNLLTLADFGRARQETEDGQIQEFSDFDLQCQEELDQDISNLDTLFAHQPGPAPTGGGNATIGELNKRLKLLEVSDKTYFRSIRVTNRQRFFDVSGGFFYAKSPIKASVTTTGSEDSSFVYAVVAPYIIEAKHALGKCIRDSLTAAGHKPSGLRTTRKMVVGALALLEFKKQQLEGGVQGGATDWLGLNLVAGDATQVQSYVQFGSAPSLQTPTLGSELMLRRNTANPEQSTLLSPNDALDKFEAGIKKYAIIGWSLVSLGDSR